MFKKVVRDFIAQQIAQHPELAFGNVAEALSISKGTISAGFEPAARWSYCLD